MNFLGDWLIDWLINWLIDGSFDFFYEKINAGQVRSWNRYCCSSNGKLQLSPLPPPQQQQTFEYESYKV